jgi:Tat protein secretion system quality control protein TatD with DNase activity
MADKQHRCHKCGGQGHIASKCRAAGKGGGKSIKCNLCGRGGHLRKECPGIDDGGAGQSIHRGRGGGARGSKKDKGVDDARDAGRKLPASAVPFIDVCCSAVAFPKSLSAAVEAQALGADFPAGSFAGGLLECPLDPLSFTWPIVDGIALALQDKKEQGKSAEDEGCIDISGMSMVSPAEAGGAPPQPRARSASGGGGRSRGRSRSDSLASQSGADKDCKLAIGFCAGVSPSAAPAFLAYHRRTTTTGEGEGEGEGGDSAALGSARRALSRVFACSRVRGLGPTGLDYSCDAAQRADQVACLRLHLLLARELRLAAPLPLPLPARAQPPAAAVEPAGPKGDQEPPLSASASASLDSKTWNKVLMIKVVPAGEVRSVLDAERLSASGGGADADLRAALDGVFRSEEECRVPLIVQLSACGIQWATVLYLMNKFCNCYFSLDCRLTHSKQKMLREYAFDLPLARLVLESSAPLFPPAGYLAPAGSHPGHVLAAAETLAEIKGGGLGLDAVLEQCYANTVHVLNC